MAAIQQPARRTNLIGPLLLIGLGVLFLAANLGLMTGSIWAAVFRLWPVLLVAAGLDIIVGRRYPWATVLIALTTVVLLLGGILLSPRWAGGTPLDTDTITEPRGTAERATIAITVGAGTLNVASLDDSLNLVEATVARGVGAEIRRDVRMAGDTAIVTLQSENRTPWMGQAGPGSVWNIHLNRGVPTALRVAAGAGQATLDLRQLQLTELAVSTGAGQTFVTLPETGVLNASVGTGAGQVVITIPSGMAARIAVSAGIGRTEVEGNYQRDDDQYVSPNYASAANRVNLHVSGGVGTIVIREADTP